jgi:hypothetical protein
LAILNWINAYKTYSFGLGSLHTLEVVLAMNCSSSNRNGHENYSYYQSLARNSAVGVLKRVLILQRKFAMVGKSEPIVIPNSGLCSSTVQGQGPNPMLWYGICEKL